MDTVAVVLVPGIFASPLDSAGGIGWPVNSLLGMAKHVVAAPIQQRYDFQHYQTSPHGGVQPRGDDPASLGWETVMKKAYRPFLEDCSKPDGPLRFTPKVFASGYNWLHSNHVSVSQLDDTVRTILRRFAGNATFRGIFFVTHSMGALNVLEALRQLEALRRVDRTAANWIDQVLGVVHVAAPLKGAPEVIMRFVRGVEDDVTGALAFGNAGWKCLTSASVVKGGFELMPFPSLLEGRPNVFRQSRVAGPADDPFYVQTIFRTVCDPTFSYVVRVVEGSTTVSTKTRTEPGRTTKDHPRRGPTIFNREAIAADLASGVRAGLEFHRRLNGYRFPYTGAVVLRGIPTCQQVKFQFSTTEIGDDTRLQEVESLRSVPNPNFNPTDFRSDGDGTVPAFSQSDIPTFSLLAGGLATDMVPSVIGIKHADALAGKVDGRPDRRVFRQVYGLLNRLHENARQRKLGGFR